MPYFHAYGLRQLMARLFIYFVRFCEAALFLSFIGFSSPVLDKLDRSQLGHADRLERAKKIIERTGDEDNRFNFSSQIEPAEPEPEESEESPAELIGTEHTGSGRDHPVFIGDCRPAFQADCDGDGEPEDLCFRNMIEGEDGQIPKHYLLVDVYKEDKWLSRQKLSLGFYHQERYSDFVDLDGDDEAELVTQVRLGPDCSGCGAYRIHAFSGCTLVNRLNIFALRPYDRRVQTILKALNRIDSKPTPGYTGAKKSDEAAACNGGDFFKEDCASWLVGSGEKILLVHTLNSRDSGIPYIGRRAGVLITEVSPKGALVRQQFFEYPAKFDETSRSAIGFLKTAGGKIHLLTAIDHVGASASYPRLEVLELHGLELKRVGELDGFYHHVIPERLIDFDNDGTTEIVYVVRSVRPPGGAAADEVPIYGIAEYRNGKYTDAGQKHDISRERLNRLYEQRLFQFIERDRIR